MEIPLIIWNAINVLRKSFNGTEIEILDTEMIRAKEGYLGVHISIYIINKYYRVFLKFNLAEDIFVYGQRVADEFIFNIIKDDFIKSQRKMKLEKIKDYE
jgi:hypothetical protein